LELNGLRWAESHENGEHKFHLYFTEACATKPWLQGILNRITDHINRRLSLPVPPDFRVRLALSPVKMYFTAAEP
jgi:hypothetical protein